MSTSPWELKDTIGSYWSKDGFILDCFRLNNALSISGA